MNLLHEIASKKRANPHGISEDIIYRWSPRIMNGQPLKATDLEPLFEASRWAPSSSNNQEWHYYYALKGERAFDVLVGCMDANNQKWYQKAGALLVLTSSKISAYKNYPIRSHSFDAGASFENLAIEGTKRGFVVHPMGGFDREKIKNILKLNDNQSVEIMIAVGFPGEVESEEEREVTQRNPIDACTTHIKITE